MQKEIESRLRIYREAIDELYTRIEAWLLDTDLKAERRDFELNEARPGKYRIQTLIIKDPDDETVARLKPIGAWIIGADGRVDVEGGAAPEVLLFWEKGAPEIKTPSNGRNGSKTLKVSRLFRGAEEPGWYWLDNVRLGTAKPLDDKELFLDIIRTVSAYEY